MTTGLKVKTGNNTTLHGDDDAHVKVTVHVNVSVARTRCNVRKSIRTINRDFFLDSQKKFRNSEFSKILRFSLFFSDSWKKNLCCPNAPPQ